jgi:hypothetical protein
VRQRWRFALALAITAAACAWGRDPSLREVLVHYESLRMEELQAQGLRVDWQRVAGRLRLGQVALRAPDTPAVSAGPEGEDEREPEPIEGTLEVLEGESGRIWTGSLVPVATRAVTPYGVREELPTEDAEAGFDVTPRVLPDGRVRLELAPFDERLGPPVVAGPGGERSTPAATVVTLAPGEKVALGALARASTSGGASVFSGIGRAQAPEERVLLVWLELE